MPDFILQIKNLTKKFGQNYALKELNLDVRSGEIFGIIGTSGAGKSTLIRCLTALERPTEGEIFLGNTSLINSTENELRAARKKIGMIFQHFNLFSSRTAVENIAYPLEIDGMSPKERTQVAQNLIQVVGLKGKEKHYPAQLSGGEQQRVAIARALARNTEILFCDEATSALDPRTTQSILELLADLNKKYGLTIVLITHEMEVIKKICTHVAVLEHGEIVETGTTISLFSKPKHPTTKHFLQNMVHSIPEHFYPKGRDEELLRLSFTGKSAHQPIISQLIRKHEVEVNILLGGIDVLSQATVGNLVVTLTGKKEERLKAALFLEENGVGIERLDRI